MSIRITQIAIETSIAPTDGNLRITQIAVETSITVNIVHQLTAFDNDVENQIPFPVYQGIQQDPNSELFTATNKTPPIAATDVILMDWKGYSIPNASKINQQEESPTYVQRRQPRVYIIIS
jgi:hypothetical protein